MRANVKFKLMCTVAAYEEDEYKQESVTDISMLADNFIHVWSDKEVLKIMITTANGLACVHKN